MREPKNQMLGTMEPPLMQLSVKKILNLSYCTLPKGKQGVAWFIHRLCILSAPCKASKLVLSSLHPRSNSMWFFTRDHSINHCSLGERRFATLYWQSSNKSRILKLVHYFVVIRSHMCRHWNSKKLTMNPTMLAKNTPLFLFPDMGFLLKIFSLEIPYMLMYSAFHINAVGLSQFKCVHPENQTKIFLILTFLWIKTNVAYTRLEVIAKTL